MKLNSIARALISSSILFVCFYVFFSFRIYRKELDSSFLWHDWDFLIVSFITLIILPFIDKEILLSYSRGWWPRAFKLLFSIIFCFLLYRLSPKSESFDQFAGETFYLSSILSIVPVLIFYFLNQSYKGKKDRTLIFLCYRRLDDVNHAVGRIYDNLSLAFSEKKVFKDVIGMVPSDNFKKIAENKIKECEIVVAVIGKKWLKTEKDRINDNEVFRELEIAFKSKKRIIPTYVGDTPQLKQEQLPENIREFADLQSMRIRSGEDFKTDIKNLVKEIRSTT